MRWRSTSITSVSPGTASAARMAATAGQHRRPASRMAASSSAAYPAIRARVAAIVGGSSRSTMRSCQSSSRSRAIEYGHCPPGVWSRAWANGRVRRRDSVSGRRGRS